MAVRRKATIAHEASYADPIAVEKGAPLALSGREEMWDGHRWLWAAAPDGREGWVPESLIVETAGGPAAKEAYSAIELTCSAGETVELLRERHGWGWCRDEEAREGWLPLRNLAEIQGGS